jgi:nitrogenase molybdenum-iron protein beta chain
MKIMDLPIGIKATDDFIMELKKTSIREVAAELDEERELIINSILDARSYFYNKKVALFGDPDLILALTGFLADMGMVPRYVITGIHDPYFEKRVQQIFTRYG